MVDYLSALNTKGSGLNITQIVDSLVEAETLPKKDSLETKKEVKELEISGLAEVKSKMSEVQASLKLLSNSNKYFPNSSSSALSISVSDGATAKAFTSEVRVVSTAARQTLQFSDNSFTTPNAAIGDGTLTINVGTWATDDGSFTNVSPAVSHSLVVNANDDLQTLATSLDSLSGVNASVLQTAPETYSLIVRSEFGADQALKITTSDSALNLFRADPSVDATVQKTRASDASLFVDGVSVTRSSNTITDLFDGYEVIVNSKSIDSDSPANGITMADPGFTVNSTLDTENAKNSMELLVAQLNDMRTKFNELTFKSIDSEDNGPLAYDPVAKGIIRNLRRLTEEGITGFGANSRHLSHLGVSTNRDGTLSFDSTLFEKTIKADPTEFDAVFNTSVSSSSSLLTVSSLRSSKPVAGEYRYSFSSSKAYLDGVEMGSGTDTSSGLTYYSANTGDPSGVTVTPKGTVTSATIYVGQSLVDKLDSFITSALASSADLSRRTQAISQDVSGISSDLTTLEDSIASLRDRYLAQFGAMESAVTGLKSTGEYLENMVQSWNSED